MNPLETLINELKTLQEAGITNLISRKESEKFFLDFKKTQWTDYSSKKQLAPDDKKNLYRAISGFGNSEGGILVWGVDTGTSSSAGSLSPINDIKNFESLINSFISRVTVPQHTSVYCFVITASTNPNEGFLVTVVPKYEGLPIQVIEDSRFYMRAGDSFVPITHSILSGLFGKKPSPNLISPFTLSKNEIILEPDQTIRFKFGLAIYNKGKGIADVVFLNVTFYGLSKNITIAYELKDTRFTGMNVFNSAMHLVSTPELKIAPEQIIQPVTITVRMKPPFTEELSFERLVGAEGQMPLKVIINNTPEELQDIYGKYIADNNFDIVDAFLKPTK